MADQMMRLVFMTLCLFPFCVASALANDQTLPVLPRPAVPLAARTGDGFHVFTHKPSEAAVVAGAGNITPPPPSPQDAGACQVPAFAPHPAVSPRINARRALYWPLLVEAACAHGVPVELMDAVVLAESRYQVLAASSAGAVGLAQLMPDTARALGVANRRDPRANLRGGARYLRQMLDLFGSPVVAVAAYNAGPGAVRRAGGIPMFAETLAYIERVMTYWRSGQEPVAQIVTVQDHSRLAAKPMTMARMTGVASQ